MGVFNWPVRLDSMDGQQSLEIEAMADTGASYTIVPANLLKDLGVSSIDTIRLVLADGRPVEYEMGEARATINGRSIPTLVVFGENNARALLGAYTLEGLRLAVDPAHGRMVPATAAWAITASTISVSFTLSHYPKISRPGITGCTSVTPLTLWFLRRSPNTTHTLKASVQTR